MRLKAEIFLSAFAIVLSILALVVTFNLNIIPISSAFLTPMIAIVTAYIAWQQYKINQNKLKLDLFEKRYKVFEGVAGLIDKVFQDAGVSKEDIAKYSAETREKDFLFNNDVLEFMKRIFENAIELRQVTQRYDYLHRTYEDNIPEKELESVTNKDAELTKWFTEQADQLKSVFMDYLGFMKNL